MAINTPIVNAPNLYVDDLQLSYNSTTKLNVAAGRARDATDTNDIILAASVVIDTSVQGINGIDVGTLAASTFYAVFAIGDSTGLNVNGALISLSTTAPLIPAGYDMVRRIGWILTDGSSNILKFYQYGNDKTRQYYYDVAIQELNAGNDTSFTAINLATSVPPIATVVLFQAVFTPDGATELAEFLPFGSTATNGIVQFGYGVAAAQTGMVAVPCALDTATPKILYKVASGDTLTLNTAGYQDYI